MRENRSFGTFMKVVAFNGSSRRGGNTAILLGHVLGELQKEGIETELVEMSGEEIHGCLACRKCSRAAGPPLLADRRYGQPVHR